MFNSISLDVLQNTVPSMFTNGGAKRTSAKYQHISTAQVVEKLMSKGFLPTWAAQCRSRTDVKKAYTKHMLRFRHVDTKLTASDLYPEIVLVNSHDGLSSYRLMAGLYRIVCGNGLIAGHSYNEIRIRHQGDIVGNVIEGTYQVIDNTTKMLSSVDAMTRIHLNENAKKKFAEAAYDLRFKDSGTQFPATHLLIPRRLEENKSDLFTIFNVVQENIIKGGLLILHKNHHYKRTRTRAINSIDQCIIINRSLWALAEQVRQNI